MGEGQQEAGNAAESQQAEQAEDVAEQGVVQSEVKVAFTGTVSEPNGEPVQQAASASSKKKKGKGKSSKPKEEAKKAPSSRVQLWAQDLAQEWSRECGEPLLLKVGYSAVCVSFVVFAVSA